MNQNINVDLIPKFAVYGNLYFSQYDVGREAIINLVNGSTEYEIPSGATVTLVATKPSGLGFTQNCTFEGNQITVVCTAEMTDEAGHFPCEIRIANGSLLLGTANITFNVERSPHPEGTTDGSIDTIIPEITELVQTAVEASESAQEYAEQAFSGTPEGYSELVEQVNSNTTSIEELATSSSVFYVATDYGISTESTNNTPALQSLINTVSGNGGGIIFFPIGTYEFQKSSGNYSVTMESNVSIIGENIEKTIFKQTGGVPYSMFYRMGTSSSPLSGCTFKNFTIDAYQTGNTNAVYGKAFFFQYVTDCVFEDLILKGTVATSLGIDFLNRVKIENVTVIDGGRTYTGTQSGTSGIGIGTGGWDEENFTITDCICVGCGQYGIFVENQHIMGWGGSTNESKGQIIADCIVRDGLNNGIGIRSGHNLIVTGCEVYGNTKHGIYVDKNINSVIISDCIIRDNSQNGITIVTDNTSEKMNIQNCLITENANNGIYICPTVSLAFHDLQIVGNTIIKNDGNGIECAFPVQFLVLMNNYTNYNAIGLYIASYNFIKLIVEYNVFFDYYCNKNTGVDSGFNDIYGDVGDSTATAKGETTDSGGGGDEGGGDDPTPTPSEPVTATDETAYTGTLSIPNADFISGYKIDSSTGLSVADTNTSISKYYNISAMGQSINATLSVSKTVRIAFYNASKEQLSNTAYTSVTELLLSVPSNAKYFRIAINNIGTASITLSTVIGSGTLTSSDMRAGVKLMPDGTETSESGPATSNAVAIPSGSATFKVISYRTVATQKLRVGFYDSNGDPTATSLPQVSTDTYSASIPNNSTQFKVCVFGYASADVEYVFI